MNTKNYQASDLELKPVFPPGTILRDNKGGQYRMSAGGLLIAEATTNADLAPGNPAVKSKKKDDAPDAAFRKMYKKMLGMDDDDDDPAMPDMKMPAMPKAKHISMHIDAGKGTVKMRMRHEQTEACPHRLTEECPCVDADFPITETCANSTACTHTNCFKCPYQMAQEMWTPSASGSTEKFQDAMRMANKEVELPCCMDDVDMKTDCDCCDKCSYTDIVATFPDTVVLLCGSHDDMFEYPYTYDGERVTLGEPKKVTLSFVAAEAVGHEAVGNSFIIEAVTKKEAGADWEAKWFAYVPDPEKPSTWKLRMAELVDGKKEITVKQLGRAAAAFSKGGFRGKKVQIPDADVSAVKAKLRSAYKNLKAFAPFSIKECAAMWEVDEETAEILQNYLTSDTDSGSILAESNDSSSAIVIADVGNVSPTPEITLDSEATSSNVRAKMLLDESFQEQIIEQPVFYGETQCEEVTNDKGVKTLKITGVCGKFNEKTANNRVYPISIYMSQKGDILEKINRAQLVGEVDHPKDGRGTVERTCVKFTSITPITESGSAVTESTDEPCMVQYTAEVAPTSKGQDLITLIKAGFGVEWSSRGYGSAKMGEWNGEKAVQIMDDNFKFLGYDAVIGAATTGTGVATFEKTQVTEPPVIGQTSESEDETVIPEPEAITTMEATKMAEDAVGTPTPVAEPAPKVEPPQAEAPDFAKLIQEGIAAGLAAVMPTLNKSAEDATEAKMVAIEKNKADTAAKITELCGTEDVPASHRETLRKYISAGATPGAVETLFNTHLPLLKEVAVIAPPSKSATDIYGFGIVNSQDMKTEMMTPIGERVERPTDVTRLIKTVSQGLPIDRISKRKLSATEEAEYQKVGFKNMGLEESPQNPRWAFERVLWNWAYRTDTTGERYPTDYIRYLKVHTQEGYENFHRNMGYFSEATLTSDFSAGNPILLPIFRAVYPRLIANEIVTTYPIAVPSAKVYLMEPQYDSGEFADQNVSNTQYFTTTFADHPENTAKASLQLVMTSASITATDKAINVVWSEQASQDLNAYFNLNLESELVRLSSDYIARELNFDLLKTIVTGAGVINENYGTVAPANYQSPLEWREELMTTIDKLGARIASARLQRPDWIVCGNMEVARLRSVTNRQVFDAQPDSQSQTSFGIGLNRVGTFNARYRVYECDWWTQAAGNNKILTGLTPMDWNNTGFLFCPYIPLYQTPVQVTSSTNTYSRALGTRYGKRLHKAACFGTVTIQPGVTTNDPLL